MKKTIIYLIFILCLPFTLALAGGETITIFNNKCSELIINISVLPYQSEGEYTLEPNCEVLSFESNIKSFKCDCPENKTTLYLTPAINSVGNYTYIIQQYVLKDNETTQPTTYNTTNPTSQNVTTIITLPNNFTINKTIQPNETLVYIETAENYVIIPDSNVTFDSFSSDNNNINIKATSSGYKCFDIYTESGAPYSIKINDNDISFTYNPATQVIHFCTEFSTKNIAVTWIIPESQATTISGGSSGGGGRALDGFSSGSKTVNISYGDVFVFRSKGQKHTFVILKVYNNSIKYRITSKPEDYVINVGEEMLIDTDENQLADFGVKLNSITKLGGLFTFTIVEESVSGGIGGSIAGPIIEEEPEVVVEEQAIGESTEPTIIEETLDEPKGKLKVVVGILIFILVLSMAGVFIWLGIRKRRRKKND